MRCHFITVMYLLLKTWKKKSTIKVLPSLILMLFVFSLFSAFFHLVFDFLGIFYTIVFFFELSKLWNINNQSLLKWFCDNTLLTIFIITCPHATISFQNVQTVYFTKNPFPYLLYIETLHVIMDILVLWFPIWI